jgi:replicative DNA helicase
MISVVRFLGRRVFTRRVMQSRWVRRAVIVMTIFRWFSRRSDRQYDVKLQRGEELDIIITKQRNGK